MNEPQISALEELICELEHAADVIIRSRLGSKTMLSDRAKLLLLLALREKLRALQEPKN